jgi:hypothetical protein
VSDKSEGYVVERNERFHIEVNGPKRGRVYLVWRIKDRQPALYFEDEG